MSLLGGGPNPLFLCPDKTKGGGGICAQMQELEKGRERVAICEPRTKASEETSLTNPSFGLPALRTVTK